jgi:pimeloyl-ACP methyl ester carboxylesterase
METMEFSKQELTVNSRDYSFRRSGGSKAPLVYLHGTDSLSHWPEMLDRLADTFDVIAPDHPGFGGTETQDQLDDVSDLAYYYLDLLEALDLRNVHLVGHSLGGWIALEMAVRSCERLCDVSLLASAGINVKGYHKADIFMIDPDEQARLAYADENLGAHAAELALQEKYEDVAITDRIAAALFQSAPGTLAAPGQDTGADCVGRTRQDIPTTTRKGHAEPASRFRAGDVARLRTPASYREAI